MYHTARAGVRAPLEGYTARTPAELREALARAASSDLHVVEVPGDAEIDMTDENCGPRPGPHAPDTGSCAPLLIPAGVTLRSSRTGRNPGGLIFTNRLFSHAMLQIDGDGARVEGLRLRGPSTSTDSELPTVFGIVLTHEWAATIANNEMWGWTGAAVRVDPGGPRLLACPPSERGRAAPVHVVGNAIHHNQRQDHGYGVVVGGGGFALIEQNTFDANRHSIAADGSYRTGYRALDNLVLRGGSEYCNWAGYCWYEQQFDMHGIGDDGNGKDGGNAGDYVELGYNTFHGAQSYAFVNTRAAYHVPGTPCDRNEIYGNAFAHEDQGAAVRNDSTRPNVTFARNLYNLDTSRELAVGDFDGDGRDDLFLATGAGWYYASGGEAAWRFLARHTERMSELRFGDFDGDRRADVFAIANGQWSVSYGATSPWQRLNAQLTTEVGTLVLADFDGDGFTDVAQTLVEPVGTTIPPTTFAHEWRVSCRGTAPWTTLRSRFDADLYGLLTTHYVGRFDGSPGADALRYRQGGDDLVRSSGARTDYVTHSVSTMR